jgi:hypothetical protein
MAKSRKSRKSRSRRCRSYVAGPRKGQRRSRKSCRSKRKRGSCGWYKARNGKAGYCSARRRKRSRKRSRSSGRKMTREQALRSPNHTWVKGVKGKRKGYPRRL